MGDHIGSYGSEDDGTSYSNKPNFRGILKSLRHVKNRLCADCNAAIGNLPVIFASCTYGVWICEDCARVHKEFGISDVKTSADSWTSEEIWQMSLHNNEQVNGVFERYIPYGWLKCNNDSTSTEREWWIQAKYDCRLFMIPGLSSLPPATGISTSTNVLPTRLIDFFLTVSLGQCDQNGSDMSHLSLTDITFHPELASCFPDMKVYPDTPIPATQLGDFVFPNGIGLETQEKSPYFFTFVLTDVSAVKLYGAVLQISELIEPEDLASLLGHAAHSPQLPRTGLVYAPKALVLLSHYPFFYLLQCLLQQIYRLSLSSCPLPLERYLLNMMEVPLPPRGCVEVSYCSLADCSLTISRPPSNQLPMIDFSFRPLFGSLSVDNILLVFSFLMMEHKVCLASSNITLLTPVQEAFLSLLYPLVWQGAYIPVLPAHMLDVLEAPVPLIVGIDSRQFPDFGKTYPTGCVTVDLDANAVHIGIDYSTGRPLVPIELPAREAVKLKAKLMEVGECIRGPRAHGNVQQDLKAAGSLFPHNEHLVPLNKFFTEEGVTLSRHRYERDYYLVDTDTKVQVPYQCTIASPPNPHILCPANNANAEDGFNAKEIRYAFLRFFLSVFRDFQHFIAAEDASQAAADKKKATSSRGSRFHRDNFLNAHSSHFFADLVETQMFSKFAEEREASPDQPEIKFFSESVIDKLNRSKKLTAKGTTPFLDSKHEEIRAIYIPPLPPKTGIRPGERFIYSHFPRLQGDSKLVPVPRILKQMTERRRLVNASAQVTVLNQSTRKRVSSRCSIGGTEEDVNVLHDGKLRFQMFDRLVTVMKSLLRMQPLRRQFVRQREMCIIIQRAYRRFLLKRLHYRYNQLQQASLRKIQSAVRSFVTRGKYLKMKLKVVLLQRNIRRYQSQMSYKIARKRIVTLQSLRRGWLARSLYLSTVCHAGSISRIVRGYLTRMKMFRLRATILKVLRRAIYILFRMNKTSLEDRSKFWLSTDRNCFLAVSVHRQQVLALWRTLKLHPPETERLWGTIIDLEQSVARLLVHVQDRSHGFDFSETTLLLSERARLYSMLKAGNTCNDRLFSTFGIAGQKRRKHNLTSSLLWNSEESADISAQAVLEILGTDMTTLHMWSTEVGRWQLLSILGEVARSFMKSVAEHKLLFIK